MIELLALPDWQAPPRTVEDWVAGLESLGHTARLVRDEDGDIWLEATGLRLRGMAVIEGGQLEAFHFEVHGEEPAQAVAALEAVASPLAWEIHPDDGEDDDE